jgi:hypothetical protein
VPACDTHASLCTLLKYIDSVFHSSFVHHPSWISGVPALASHTGPAPFQPPTQERCVIGAVGVNNVCNRLELLLLNCT